MKWTYELLITESKKYNTRTEFARGSNSAYKISLKQNLLDKMPWLSNHKNDKRPRCIYAYIDEDNKVAYIGLTVNKELRHNTHISGKFSINKESKSPVYKYFQSIHKNIPEPIYLEENLSIIDAQEKENYWINIYKSNGYILLNKAKTGKYVGSIGLHFKWFNETVIEESKKYTNKRDFRKYSENAYEYARIHKLFDKMPWIKPLHRVPWTKDEVFEESHKYTSRIEFSKKCKSAYNISLKNNWLNEMSWLNKPIRISKWNKKTTFEESHKYNSIKEFSRRCSAGYKKARENGWINEMTWLKVKI